MPFSYPDLRQKVDDFLGDRPERIVAGDWHIRLNREDAYQLLAFTTPEIWGSEAWSVLRPGGIEAVVAKHFGVQVRVVAGATEAVEGIRPDSNPDLK